MKIVTVDGVKVDAAAMLAALHNNTRALGLGALHDIGRRMTRDEAAKHVEGDSFYFDYFCGRPLKVHAEKDGSIDEHSRRLYDRDAGDGSFARALSEALQTPVTDDASAASAEAG